MSLWAKIQTLSSDCQRQILALYSDEHANYKFPIEVRNLFADLIETAVCGGNICSIDNGLDPYNLQHNDLIVNFLTSLVGKLEERLGNSQSGDQFFTQHKLSEALGNIKEKRLSDPLGVYEFIRNRIRSEIELVAQQEANDLGNMADARDVILANIIGLKNDIAQGNSILKQIRSNEEDFSLNFTKKQDLENLLQNREQLNRVIQQYPDIINYENQVKDKVGSLDAMLQQNVRNFSTLMQRFEHVLKVNLDNVSILQGQIISEKLAVWKHEQQQMANGIQKTHFVSLDRLQAWCEGLAELIWKLYEQLKESELILGQGKIPSATATADLTFVQCRAEDVLRLLQDLLNNCLIVEEQPPQILKTKTKFPKAVIVSLLIGKQLNVHMNSPELTACIISEDQARSLPVTDKLETVGDLTNGKVMMDKSKDDFKRITFPFRNLQLKSIRRTDRRGSVTSERVMEEKSCLYFETAVTVGPLKFKVSTISLPVVVTSHGSQEALAVASISWDNAFGEIGRQPFKVPSSAPWKDVEQILDAKFREVTGRGLTPVNLACLAKKVFRNRQPQPETITWSELCKENLPGKAFTFWAWFHAALKLIEKKDNNLKELWKDGLIVGFIEREQAENVIQQCEIGTFLLRFSDSIMGAMTIVLLLRPGNVVSLNPFQMLDLQSKPLALSIKDIDKLKYLYQPNRCIPKDDAFKKFYSIESNHANVADKKGYVQLIPTVPDDFSSRNGSETPQPLYIGSTTPRNSIPGLSPLHMPDHSQNLFFMHPPSPATSISTYGVPSPAPTLLMDTRFSMPNDSSLGQTSYSSSPPDHDDINTPIPTGSGSVDGQMFTFQSSNAIGFEDLITVFQDARSSDQMDED